MFHVIVVFVQVLLLVVALLLLSLVVLYYRYKHNTTKNAKFFANTLIGHRGSNHSDLEFMENSTEAMTFALEQGNVDGVEFDIVLSKDGVPMIFHDTHRMSRVCVNSNNYKEEKSISQLTCEEIQSNYVYLKGTEQSVIPTLEQMLDHVMSIRPDAKLFIEVKELGSLKSKLVAQKVSQCFKKYKQLYTQAVVASFSPVALYQMRSVDPDVVTALIYTKGMIQGFIKYTAMTNQDTTTQKSTNLRQQLKLQIASVLDKLLYWSTITWIPSFIGAGVMSMNNEIAKSLSHVVWMQQRGYTVSVWTVNDPSQKSTLQQLGASVTTDFLFPYKDTSSLPSSIQTIINMVK
jgi:glycerophosphoryl diester phosphodiesterase